MKFKAAILLVAALFAGPVLAQERSLPAEKPYVMRLSDIMGATQLRHIKLWYAGAQKNWPLAQYELGQIKESFQDAMTYYPGIPASDMSSLDKPAAAIGAAIGAKDSAAFAKAYNAMTAACNACHKAQGYGFIVVKVPNSSPFSDQLFPPRR